ncbi:MAG: AbiH family protein [Candidatus Gastranaerophilaceae bacterium]|nr:AbiH family protein [Candidatus Gastranaerophilaceae bacterium]
MDILILGNGFDLAHDLETRYGNFLEYCKKKYSTTKNVGGNDSNNFLFENVWVKHFLNKTLEGDKWIDLENEIYEVIKKLSRLPYFKSKNAYYMSEEYLFVLPKYYSNFNFEEINNFFIARNSHILADSDIIIKINEFINFLYNQLRDFINEFEKYLKEVELPKIDKNNPKYKFSLAKNKQKEMVRDVFILNFNYTNIFEELYANDQNNKYIIKKPVYIHGKINENNMILGTKSYSNESISVEFNIFKKHHQRHRYGTIEAYQKLLNIIKLCQQQINFHIIGHSLDSSDRELLKHILTKNPNSTINIYYHDEEALTRMQNNIDLIIGEEEVMEKVRFIKQDDLNRGILIPLNNELK